jgi:peptide/nickel transport system permease protein
MSRLIMTRVVLGLLTLLGVSLLIFAATEVLPGDVATAVLGQGATPDTVAEFRKEVGLDRPPLVRYWDWLSHAVRGDFGRALTNKRDINKTMAPKLSNTLFLALYAALIAVPLAVGLGILAAIKEGKWVDKVANVVSLAAISMPEFFLGQLFIFILAVQLHWFPSLATVFNSMHFGEKIYVVFMPAVCLTLLVTAHMLRMTRSSVLSIMSQP